MSSIKGHFQSNFRLGQSLGHNKKKCNISSLYYIRALESFVKDKFNDSSSNIFKTKFRSKINQQKESKIIDEEDGIPIHFENKHEVISVPKNFFKNILVDSELNYISLESEFFAHNKMLSTIPQYVQHVLKALSNSDSYSDYSETVPKYNSLTDILFLNNHEKFVDIAKVFLYGRYGYEKDFEKTIFFLKLASNMDKTEAHSFLCEIYFYLDMDNDSEICFQQIENKGKFTGSFGLQLLKMKKQGYLHTEDFMKLMFFGRTASLNKSNFAIYYTVALWFKFQGNFNNHF